MFESVMGASMMRIAQEKGLLDFTAYDLRDWTHDRHRTTDDDPYGGGVGLVMKCGPIFEAYQDITNIYLGIEPDSTSGIRSAMTIWPLYLSRMSSRVCVYLCMSFLPAYTQNLSSPLPYPDNLSA